MARAALQQLKLDQLVWIPTGAPGYRNAPLATPEHRLAMLRIALDGDHKSVIDERELAPGASGYTVDTLKDLRRERKDAELFLLLGADQYANFQRWREPEEVARLARLAVFARPGFEVKHGNALAVSMAPMPVSASDIRARAARGEKLDGLVPAAVENYISRHRLYR